MRSCHFYALLALVGILSTSSLQAQQVDGRIEGKMVDTGLQSSGTGVMETPDSGTKGAATTFSKSDTKEREGTYEFNGSINSLVPLTLEKVSVKVYVIARDYKMNSAKSQEAIVKILEKNDIVLKKGEMLDLKMGSCSFTRSQTRTVQRTDFKSSNVNDVTTSYKIRDGEKYMGCVMEIYIDGKLDKVVENISSSGLDAYKNKVMKLRP